MWWRSRKGLFKYWGGRKRGRVYGDPLAILTRLAEDPELVSDKHVKAALSGDAQATQIIARATARAFEVDIYNSHTEMGLTVSELLELFFRFEVWTELVKKNTSTSSTPPSSTESTSTESEEPTQSDTPLSALQQEMLNSGGKMWCGSAHGRAAERPLVVTPPLSTGTET